MLTHAKGSRLGGNPLVYAATIAFLNAGRLIEGGTKPAKAARKATKASGPRTRSKAPAAR